jgi:glycine/D-amino acid oxidase-like deaminating enzyme
MDRHSHVFVIGGGIIGLASAYYLAKEGKGVRLAPDIKRFMWFLNFASKCNPGLMAHAIRAREKILQNSKSLFETLFREEQLECDWEEKGALLAFKIQTEMQKYVQTNDRL